MACRYYLDAGPQHTEFVTQFLGPSECGKFDVLWEESDMTEEVTVAVAWLPRGQLQGFELWQALALAWGVALPEGADACATLVHQVLQEFEVVQALVRARG